MSSKLSIHLGNGGFNFKVEKLSFKNNHIPVLNISADSFGHQMNEIKINSTPEHLKALGEFLIQEAEKSKSYYKNDRKNDPWNGLANCRLIID